MKEIIPIHKALNTEETPMGPVPSRRKTDNSSRLIDHYSWLSKIGDLDNSRAIDQPAAMKLSSA